MVAAEVEFQGTAALILVEISGTRSLQSSKVGFGSIATCFLCLLRQFLYIRFDFS